MIEELSIEQLKEIIQDGMKWNTYNLDQKYHSLLYRTTSKVQGCSDGIVTVTDVVDAASVELLRRSISNS